MWTQIGKPEIIKRTQEEQIIVRLQEGYSNNKSNRCPGLNLVREVLFDPIKDQFTITTWERIPD
jgi:hypothetical protein